MARTKTVITDEILKNIEYYAEDQYTLKELLDELNISQKLVEDERVLQAYEKGLIKLYIWMASNGMSDDEIIDDKPISAKQCTLWRELYSDRIEQGLQKKKDREKRAARQISNPLRNGMANMTIQRGQDQEPISYQVLHDDIEKMVEEMQSGDTTAQLAILTMNILQLQQFNGQITHNITGEAGKQMDNFNKLSNMQLKVMQETRKSIMAINEITNPKRTTFIKEASQHNHLHQNLEKKDENENELQTPEQLNEPDPFTEAEVIPIKEKVK